LFALGAFNSAPRTADSPHRDQPRRLEDADLPRHAREREMGFSARSVIEGSGRPGCSEAPNRWTVQSALPFG